MTKYYENDKPVSEEYYQKSERHREYGPEAISFFGYYENGKPVSEEYYQKSERHREYGPEEVSFFGYHENYRHGVDSGDAPQVFPQRENYLDDSSNQDKELRLNRLNEFREDEIETPSQEQQTNILPGSDVQERKSKLQGLLSKMKQCNQRAKQ